MQFRTKKHLSFQEMYLKLVHQKEKRKGNFKLDSVHFKLQLKIANYFACILRKYRKRKRIENISKIKWYVGKKNSHQENKNEKKNIRHFSRRTFKDCKPLKMYFVFLFEKIVFVLFI